MTETDSNIATDEDYSKESNKNKRPAALAGEEDKAADTADRLQKRQQRGNLFAAGLFFSAIYLLALIISLIVYLTSGSLPMLEQESGWKALVAVDGAFVLMAFIPMSIFWTLAKMSSAHHSTDNQKTDGEALANSIYDAASSVKEMITALLSAVKK